jgi:DNA-binding response OmpR family regulator
MKKILVVDDDRAILDSLKIILEDDGFKVLVEETGGLAEEKAKEYSPDLILLDIWLPDASGLEVAKRLKSAKETKKIPIILVSALSNAAKMSKQSPAEDFIEKPFDIDLLLKKVRKYL